MPLPPLGGNPTVSIVVPSFNQGRYIRATIDSILSQSYRPLQIIVVDGGSCDETVSVLRSYGEIPELEWTSEPDKGVVDAVNKGFARVRGQIVAIQSSDDCYLPDAIRRAVDEFQDDQHLGLLYGDTIKIDADGRELSRHRIGPYSLLNLLRIRTWIPQPSAFFRRELLDALGGWNDRIPYAPDTDLWLRMAFRTQVKKIDVFLSQRRLHGEQRDTQAARISRDFALMIEQSPDIANAPREIRRAAQAGKHLMRVRYNPTESDWYAAWCLMRAGWADRACLDAKGIVRQLFMPVRRKLSFVKRRFGMGRHT
ncbi:MAG: glycosyltransferase [Planctomycetes bacterium]|nr:glycosyltransferase [Planctomycetota bacterium]